MAYTPNTWATGDTITAARLNNMEQGIANSGVFRIEATWDDDAGGYVLDKTLAEISAAYSSGRTCKIYGEVVSEISISETPFGQRWTFQASTYVDPYTTPPLLSYTTYDLNESTGVITATEYQYTLTPAS